MRFTKKRQLIGGKKAARSKGEFLKDQAKVTDTGITDGVLNTSNGGGQEELQGGGRGKGGVHKLFTVFQKALWKLPLDKTPSFFPFGRHSINSVG